jgi:uncharacterized repeat protein (TIGR01451 family)
MINTRTQTVSEQLASGERGTPALRHLAVGAVLAAAAVLLLIAPAAVADAPAPAWNITSVSLPTNFAPGSTYSSSGDQYLVTVTDLGAAPISGQVTVTDTLPAGVTLDSQGASGLGSCTGAGQVVTCTGSQTIQPSESVPISIPVDVTAASGTVTNSVSVSGGGAAQISATATNTISATPAGFGLQRFDGLTANEDGSPDTQAGSHPYQMMTTFSLNTTTDARGNVTTGGGEMKDAVVDLPPGLIGDPGATPQCSSSDFTANNPNTGGPTCPDDSAVGVMNVTENNGSSYSLTLPVYNLVPQPGAPAQFGASLLQHPIVLTASVRSGDGYGLRISLSNVSQGFDITGSSVTFWGVPADPSHDSVRGSCQGFFGPSGATCPANVPAKPFLTLPTACSGPLTTMIRADSWSNPGSFVSDSYVSHDNSSPPQPVGIAGCDRLDFSPTITVQPDTTVADSPTGLSVDLQVPQNDNPTGLAEADLKDAVVTLPAGVSVNPASADGRQACTPGQIGLDNANEPSCPDASKIGTVELDTPLLPDPLKGSVFLAQQTNNPFGSLLAIYLTAKADGVLVKLAGHLVADPVTGQLTTTFSNNPQLPFTDFKLDFFGGPRGALATPESCGTFTTGADLTPWSGTGTVSLSDPFTFNSGCVTGFAPSFSAGTQNAQAGAYSPFVLSLSRSDTDQNFQGLSVKLPPGMLANLSQVQECSDAQLASISSAAGTAAGELANPACPAGSQVGTVTAGSGVGPDPFFLGGKAYLTGPYKGAPYGLAVVVPAVAGPLDLGTVVVRQALYVDPTTAQVTAVSDPFPTILQGIPLRIRRIDVNLNRHDFTVNPTSCDPMKVTGTLSSTGGLSAPVSSRFQVGGCSSLSFSPKLKMALTGKGKTKSGDHPALVSTLTQPFGQANIHNVKVTLPLSMALDPNNSQHVCNYDVALAVHGGAVGCPASTIVGTASAITPLLSKPLTGKAYLVQGIRFSHGNRIRTLPSLLVALRGQIALDLRANTSVNGASQLVTTFSTIPDAPVSKFTLTITGGKKGLLVITGRGRTICNKPQMTGATLGAQSGKTESSSITMSTPCPKVTHAKKRSKKGKKHGKK